MNLIVPDIHEQPEVLAELGPLFLKATKVYFLGDWFDSFNMKSDTAWTIMFLKEFLKDDKYEFCIGNHDCHYFFDNPKFMCSGFRLGTLKLVRQNLKQSELQKFKMFHRIGDTVVSHAGYHPKYLGDVNAGGTYSLPYEKEANDAMDLAFAGGFHRLFNPGAPVGGRGIGGPTWLRPEEWERVGFVQVVGHTPQKEPNFDTTLNAMFLDTHLKHLLWVNDDGKPEEIVVLADGKSS